jgi:hypothetical protein
VKPVRRAARRNRSLPFAKENDWTGRTYLMKPMATSSRATLPDSWLTEFLVAALKDCRRKKRAVIRSLAILEISKVKTDEARSLTLHISSKLAAGGSQSCRTTTN